MRNDALVLGAGGVTGVGWEVGMLTGLLDAGVNLSGAELVIGTSAGAAVAAQVTSGTPLVELFARQVEPKSGELPARLSTSTLLKLVWYALGERDAQRFGAKMGKLALAAKTVDEATRREVIAARLPRHTWPEEALLLTAVNAQTGAFRVFDRASNVSLVDAVSASCAVPGVWPPVSIEGEKWIDGGMRSAVNADLARGRARVVILAPIVFGLGPMTSVATQANALRAAGAAVVVISPDAAAKQLMGRNTLDPSRRAVSAQAGRRQAAEVAREVAAVWSRHE